MPTPRTPVALIAGDLGPMAEALARELRELGIRPALLWRDSSLEGAETLFFLRLSAYGPPLASSVAAAAGLSERLRRLILVAAAPPSADVQVAEDALRYLAGQRSASFNLLLTRPYAAPEALAGRLARLAEGGAPPGAPPVVLLTGASGQIGRAMAALLDERKIAHLDVHRTRPGSRSPFLRCDLADPAGLARLAEFCRPATHVIHLASRITNAKDLASAYREQFDVNVIATLNLLEALPPAVRHFAYASSFTVYGNTRASPVDEGHPVAPGNVYGLCKLAVERQLAEFGARTGTRVAVLRYASVYGPGPAPGRAIPTMISRLLEGLPPEIFGDGTARRDYIYVDDVCRATLQASLREAEGVFNIGTGAGTSTAELAGLLSRLTRSAAAPIFVPGAPDAPAASSLVYDVGKMRRELGCVPAVSLEEGLLKTIRCLSGLPRST